MSANTANKKIIIKPLMPTEFEADSVKYSAVKINTEIKTKWVDTSYSRGGNDEKFLVVARGCVVKTFKKMEKPKDAKDDGKVRKDKFQIFMGLRAEAFIEMVKNYETALIHVGV